MTVLIDDTADITLETYRRVSWEGESVSLTEGALERIGAIRQQFLNYLDQNDAAPIYGVNVGAGDGSFTSLSPEGQQNYAQGLNSATSFGSALPERVVRGIVLARLSSFVDGSSAVGRDLTEYVAGMLSAPLPTVPAEGTRGSGEILPLGHLFASVPAALPLGPKESMALVNGAPCAGALSADIAIRAQGAITLAEQVMALACDALKAPEAHFDEALADVWGYPEERATLRRMRELLSQPSEPRHDHQARVSVRIVPRCLATAQMATSGLSEEATIALQHPGDNPAFIHADGNPRVISNGSFHNQRALVAVDTAARTLADLTQLGQHLIHALYQDREAMPTQDNLSLGITYMVAADWSEEARLHASPSVLSFAAVGQNDVPFPMFASWRAADRIIDCLTAQLATLAAMASQSLHTTMRATTPALSELLELVRSEVSPIDERRDIGVDLQRLASRFRDLISPEAFAPMEREGLLVT